MQDIDNFIGQHAGYYSEFYCGIASNPRDRLFNGHGVNEKTDWWKYKDFGTDTVARQVEKHFLAKGCKGDDGGGDSTTRFVYVYKVGNHTRE
ncbi:MAG: hypothetical protein A2Y12_03975 [Planctomycetes bacterium GWF2_42_9]|nr:MAG: hypothetical protein A2Y12_03975 [Planctomycetes bacterium GWF2_42_9]